MMNSLHGKYFLDLQCTADASRVMTEKRVHRVMLGKTFARSHLAYACLFPVFRADPRLLIRARQENRSKVVATSSGPLMADQIFSRNEYIYYHSTLSVKKLDISMLKYGESIH